MFTSAHIFKPKMIGSEVRRGGCKVSVVIIAEKAKMTITRFALSPLLPQPQTHPLVFFSCYGDTTSDMRNNEGINFTNILLTAFAPISLHQKNYKP